MQKTDWLLNGLVMAGMVTMVACGQRDAVEVVGDWYHQHQGGEIARQRPPAPGIHEAYPRVGLTPSAAVELPSASARQALTDRLMLQRSFNQHLAVADGPLTIVPQPSKSPIIRSEKGTSTSVVASGQTSSANPTASTSRTDKASKLVAASEATMPEVTRFAPRSVAPEEMPQISALPPTAPGFPGFNIPRDSALPDSVLPTYDLTEPHGTLIRFAQASDQVVRGQESVIGKALDARGPHGEIYVKGYGEISSFRPSEQVLGVRLGLSRARAVAQTLILHGVSASDIRISAGAMGRGARIDRSPF